MALSSPDPGDLLRSIEPHTDGDDVAAGRTGEHATVLLALPVVSNELTPGPAVTAIAS